MSWILLSGALLVQWFRSVLSYSVARGGADSESFRIADDWMGLGFALLIVASMYMMREVLARHSLSEERLRVVSAAAQDAVVMMDNKGRIAFWNDAGERIFGYREAEARGKTLHQLIIPARHRAEFERNFIDFRKTGQGPVIGRTLELAGLRKDGTEIVTEVSDFRGEHRLEMARDLHFPRRHRTQAQPSRWSRSSTPSCAASTARTAPPRRSER